MIIRKRTKAQYPCDNNAGLPECNLVAEIAEKQKRISHLEAVISELDKVLTTSKWEQLAIMTSNCLNPGYYMSCTDKSSKILSLNYAEARRTIERYMRASGHSIPKLIDELRKIDELYKTRRENVFEMQCLQSEVDQAKAKLGIV